MELINRFFSNIKGDRGIWVVVILLYLASIIMVYSTSTALAYAGRVRSTESILFSQILFVALGITALYIVHKINYNHYARFAILLFAISIPLLFYTMIWGVEINGARRWIRVPFVGIMFQTSDLGKLGLVMYLSYMLSLKKKKVTANFKSMFCYIGLPVQTIVGLIAPWNMSTALMVFCLSMLLFIIAKLPFIQISRFMLLSLSMFALFIACLKFTGTSRFRLATWEKRMEQFIGSVLSDKASTDRDLDTFQADQAKAAIASGGLFGVGPGNSRAKHFLFSAHADLIYPIIIEEHGLLKGGFLILILYLLLFYRCIKIFKVSTGRFGSFLALGLGLMLLLQALLNMAVSVNLLPVTGVALPLISKGGTSLLFTSVAIGIILSVSVYIDSNAKKENDTRATASSRSIKMA